MDRDADRALLARVARRDHAAFVALVGASWRGLLAVARRLLSEGPGRRRGRRPAGFPPVYLGASAYRAEWAVSTWLYPILTNVCIDELRRRETRATHADATRRLAPAGAAPPAAGLDLRRALRRVPREARVLLALHYVDGLSYRELARARGISVNTVKSQLARGKAILRQRLAEGARHDRDLARDLDHRLAEHFRPEPLPPAFADRLLAAARARPGLPTLADRLAIDVTADGVARVRLGRQAEAPTAALRRLVDRTRRELREYLAGQRAFFSVPLDLVGPGAVPAGGSSRRPGGSASARPGPTPGWRPASGTPRPCGPWGRPSGGTLSRFSCRATGCCGRTGGLGGYLLGVDVKDRLLALERTTPVLEGCTSTRHRLPGGLHPRPPHAGLTIAGCSPRR